MRELLQRQTPLVRDMLDHEFVKFGLLEPRQLSDGCWSRFYADLRPMISVPRLFDAATDEYIDVLQDTRLHVRPDGTYRYLQAIPEAVNYYVGAIAKVIKVPLLQRRVKVKAHGVPSSIEGIYEEGDECVLIDDAVTSSSSIKKERAFLAQEGIRTTAAILLIDREQGGRTELEAIGMQFAAAMTISGIAKYALDEGLGNMTQALYDDTLAELDLEEMSTNQTIPIR